MTRSKKIPIAIADDHTMFRLGLIALLKNYKEVEVLFDAANGQELLDKIFVAEKRPAVCIIDVNMPVLHGYDTAKQIKKFFPEIKMLALSMYDDEINIIQMLRSGAHGYLLKDSEPSKLVEAIHIVMEKGFYHSELTTNNVLTNLKFEKMNEMVLTTNELEFIKYACTEMTYKEIAITMQLAERTVDGYRDRMFEKLNVKSRIGLVIYALRHGIVDLY